MLLVCGYFDWFSGYQETGLARALAPLVEAHVLAGDRVNPIFSDAHLERVSQKRNYPPGTSVENGVTLTRVRCHERRSMLWSSEAKHLIADGDYDLVIQVMPGQVLPAAASLAGGHIQRSVLYGDNVAMYAALGSLTAKFKYLAFGMTKGPLYGFVNRRASHLYGYTPNTLSRLAPFLARRDMKLLPLAFDSAIFEHRDDLRTLWRTAHGYTEDDIVVLAAGKIQRQKRIEDLTRAMALLRDRHPDVRLHIIGVDDSPASQAVRAAAAETSVDGLVTVEGFVNAAVLNEAFNGADVGVWPVMPAITIQQAMGTGLRVLLPRNDLVSHLVARPEVGTTYVAREPLSHVLAHSLDELLSHAATTTQEENLALRRERTNANAWLSTTAIARQLLADAGLRGGIS